MKFGHNLPRNQVPEWAANYINYKGLKKLIKNAAEASKDGSAPDLAAMSERMPIMSMITNFDEHVADIQIQSSSSRSIVTSKTSITSTTANMPRTRDGYDFCMAAMDESHNYPRVSIRTKRKISWARCLNCVDQCGSFNGMEK
ncbi:Glycerophosphodiester phosphodiesterase [Alternaria alternata]|nr:Glycerophosphodiester phosphodiesterase [Alternaria alternata]